MEPKLIDHLLDLPFNRKGWVVYPFMCPAYIEYSTVPASDLVDRLAPTSERMCGMLFSALRAVQRHPACEPGYLKPARIGYSPLEGDIYLCFVDERRDLMFVTTHGLWESLGARCIYCPLIMSPMVLVGESYMLTRKILRAHGQQNPMDFYSSDRHLALGS